jgi:hypothetical protein
VDSPSQNGAIEVYNDKFAVPTRTLFYAFSLPAKLWSAALLHSVYLHNWLVHTNTKVTPFKGYFWRKPNLSNQKVFGSWVIPVPKVQCMVNHPLPPVLHCSLQFEPTRKARQLESEIWLLWLGSTGVTQLDVLPQNVTGLPATFQYHPFQFVDFKEEACVCKQVAQRSAVRAPECCWRFYMGFGFMRASTSDYTH